MKPKKKEPNWTDLKRKLVDLDNLDKAELIKIIQNLRSVNKANQTFLNTRFCLILRMEGRSRGKRNKCSKAERSELCRLAS